MPIPVLFPLPGLQVSSLVPSTSPSPYPLPASTSCPPAPRAPSFAPNAALALSLAPSSSPGFILFPHPPPGSTPRPSPSSGLHPSLLAALRDPSLALAHLLELLLLHDARLLGSDNTTWGKMRSREAWKPRVHLAPKSPGRSLPPFLGPRFFSEAAAAVLLFAGLCAWNLRCPCAMIRHATEEAWQ